MMRGKYWIGGINVSFFVMGKGMVDLGMWFSCLYGGEVNAKTWSVINITEGVEFQFKMFQNGVVVVC